MTKPSLRQAWLVSDPDSVVHGEGLLPTTKSIAFASWNTARGRLEYVSPQDPDEHEFFVPRVIEAITLGNLPRERAARMFPKRTGTDIGLYLGLQVVSNGSVAVFCGRKDSAALLCDGCRGLCPKCAIRQTGRNVQRCGGRQDRIPVSAPSWSTGRCNPGGDDWYLSASCQCAAWSSTVD